MSSAVCCRMRGEVGRLVQRVRQVRQLAFDRRTHEVVAVIDHQRDAGMVLFVDAPRKLRWNNHRAFQLSVAHVFPGLALVVVGDRNEGANIRAH